jgi:S1-C subfamily serine protease
LTFVEWDDEGLEDGSPSPLLPPDDRLWRHPSEVAAAGPQPSVVRGFVGASSGSTSTGPPKVVTVVALTSCISVLITLGVVAVARPFRVVRMEREAPGPGAADVTDVAAVTSALRPAIAQVVAVGAGAGGADRVGSGVIFRDDGLMLTAEHVVAGATALRVLLDDGRSVVATLVGADPETDIAVLDLEGAAFPVATLAPSASVVGVGDSAITIGSGGSASPVVRVSVVSAMGQEAGLEGRKLVDMIRVDSAMAAGCSGGAVVDAAGRVIGIAAANVAGAEGESATGYATPIHVARSVADELVATGHVVRGWLGIEGESRAGALVHRVKPGSPAEAAGLAAGDVITAVDGAAVATMSALVARLRTLDPGDQVSLSVERGGQQVVVDATLAEKPTTT